MRAFRLLRPHLLARRRMLAGTAGALVGGALVEVLKPWPLKFVFDYLLKLKDGRLVPSGLLARVGDDPTGLLLAVCTSMLLIWLLSSLTAYLREYLSSRVAEEVVFELRVMLFGHLQRLSLGFHDSRRLGDMMTRVTTDTDAMRELVGRAWLQWCTAVITLVGTLGVMVVMDWRLSLVGFATVAAICPVEWWLRRRIKAASQEKRQREVGVSSVTQETIGAIRVVRAFGREDYQQQQFGRESSESVKAGIEAARLEAQYIRTMDVIGALATCAVVWWGVHRVFAGVLTPGDLYVFINYVRGLHGPLRDIAKQSIRVAKGRVGLERVLEILDVAPAVEDSPHARPAPRLRGAVEFQDVSFAYRPGQPVLQDVSFRVEPGQTVALVGYSGAGKSTLLSLIPRLYEPSSGRILIDGEDIRNFTLDSLREQLGFVLQESVLFQTTVLENILYGRPGASADDVAQAAVASGVQQFIGRLKDQYCTVVGPRGTTLSGGERQRVAIARAMIRKPPVLLLDEPTAGLDVESEKLVMDALERLMSGKTTLLISHKLSLIERVDTVLVIDGGRIAEAGSPAELRAADGLYARLSELASANYGVIQDRPHQSLHPAGRLTDEG